MLKSILILKVILGFTNISETLKQLAPNRISMRDLIVGGLCHFFDVERVPTFPNQ